MPLSENLPYLRSRQGMTQEQLAERLDVSRQSVSKWESGASYPEMETILKICDLFHIDLDTLLRGSAEQALREDTAGYDRFMTLYARKVAGAVSAIIGGVALWIALYTGGLSPELGLTAFLLVVAVSTVVLIASGMEEDHFRKRHPAIPDFYTEAQRERFHRQYIWYIAGGVGGILLGVALICLGSYVLPQTELMENIMGGLFLLIVAAAVYFLIYGGMQEDKYNIAKYNRENNPTPEDRERRRRFITAAATVMLLATALFLFLGLAYDRWEMAAIIYPVGGVLCGVARVLLGPKLDS